MTYTSNDQTVKITIRQVGKNRIAWACHVNGSYRGSKVLPSNNTAVVQNFGYEAKDFTVNQ